MATNNLINQRIETNPHVMIGKPVFRGTRIPVYIDLDLYDSGASDSEIMEEYPDLAPEDITAARALREQQDSGFIVRAL